MNKYKYQLIAFGAFGIVGLAYIVTSLYDLTALWAMVIITLIVAVLTLATTRKLLYSIGQVICVVVAAVGHAISIICDDVADWCKERKSLLGSPGVPDWKDLEPLQADTATQPETPVFIGRVMADQNS